MPGATSPLYTNDFEGSVGPEWSNTGIDTTPTGGRKFLGQFGNQTVSLALNNLPTHTQLQVSFDLYIIGTWDGNDAVYGPDIWDLSVNGDPSPLLHTTFTNRGDTAQAYPDAFSAGSHPNFSDVFALNAFQSAATSVGTNVVVPTTSTFFNSETGTTTTVETDVTYGGVSSSGTTTVTSTSNAAGTLDSHFAVNAGVCSGTSTGCATDADCATGTSCVGYHAAFFDVSTTATVTGPFTICSHYADVNNDGIVDGTSINEM